jgi:REP element-mobilizing transposase RayT
LEREIAGTEAGCYGRKLPGCFESAEGLCENEFHGTRNATFRSSRPPCRRSSMTADDSQRYRLIGYAVMNDHVHVVVEPSMGYDLTAIVQSWKSYTTIRVLRSFGRKGRIWQREYFDRVIRDDEELRNRLAYILGNPGTRWQEIEDYSWAWVEGVF